MCVIIFAIWFASNRDGAFLFDDRPNIAENKAVTGFAPRSLESWEKAAFHSPARLRPLPYLTFAWQWRLHGQNLAAFHAANDLFHGLAAALLFLFLLELFHRHLPKLPGKIEPWHLAAAGALIWAVHPAQTQAVTYVVQRMTVMAGMFSFAALWLYLHARRVNSKKTYAAAAASYFLALLSKESAAALPVLVLLYELVAGSGEDPSVRRKRLILLSLSLMPPVLMATGYAALSGAHFGAGQLPGRTYTLADRVLSAPRAYWKYLGLLLFPKNLALDHGMSVSQGILSPWTTLPAWLAGIPVLGTFFWLLRSDKKVVALGPLCFVLALAPESTFLNLELFYEHRLYFPSAFLLPLIPPGFLQLAEQRPPFKIAAALALIFLAFAATTRTISRNRDWQSPVRLLEKNAVVTPENARVHYNLGQEFVREGKIEDALPHYLRAEELGYAEAPFAIGTAYHQLGKAEEAMKAYERALTKHPHPSEVWLNLGLLAKQMRDPERAEKAYTRAIQEDPENASAYSNLGNLLREQGRLDDALKTLDYAAQKFPDRGDIFLNRMLVFIQKEDMAAARKDWEKSRELGVPLADKYAEFFKTP
ncbi:MAG: tetratricopeptide repeat protein [Bdellovibrionota bacterium]